MKFTILSKSLMTIVLFTSTYQINAQQKAPGINLSLMDNTVSPKNDFFNFVNGTWLKNTEIPADKTRWGSFDELRQNTDKDALAILNDAAKNPKYGSNTDQGKAINMYKAAMDTVARNKYGIDPIRPYLAKIAEVKNMVDLQKLMMQEEAKGGGVGFFGVGIGADDKNSNRNVVSLGPGGLGLPDRDYYVSDDKDSKEKREKYVLHVARMLQFIGEKPEQAKANAAKILALETAMSSPRLDRVERRDARKQYNPTAIADLQKMVPSIDWNTYLREVGFKKLDTIIVSQPRYMAALQTIFTENKVEDWKEYMRWMLLRRSASTLSTDIETANWEFYGKTLTGALKQRPRHEKALQVVNGTVGEALGKLYVEKMFPEEAKGKAARMIKNVIRAYENRINNLTWMSAETKTKAIQKLNGITIKIGYPDKWKDMSSVTINRNDYCANVMAVNKWEYNYMINKYGKPVDRTEWGMYPQTYNAYYNPSNNEIVLPAAIFTIPGMRDEEVDDAVVYGYAGASTIGHEITHGFDDEGRQFDADGNLKSWWTKADGDKFNAKAALMVKQFDDFVVLDSLHVNGKATLGENIADLGGIVLGFEAFKKTAQYKAGKKINGLTPQQRYFLGYALGWLGAQRNERLANQILTDVHSPANLRVNGPFANLPEFYEAFGIKQGNPMWRPEAVRVKIW